jgi:hypothetical protein
VTLVVVDAAAEGSHPDPGQAAEAERPRMPRNPGRWEPWEVGERERDLDLQICSDRRAEAGAEDEPDRRDQVGPRSNDLGTLGGKVVARAREPGRHVTLASAAFSRSITATGVGSTPRRSAT